MVETTSIIGPIFVLIFSIAGMYLLSKLWAIWRIWYTSEHKFPMPQITKTLAIIGVYVIGIATAWSLLQKNTTTMSHYKSQAEITEQKAVKDTPTPNKSELIAKQENQEKESEKSHQEALSSYDQSMAQEEQKIRERSQTP